MKNFPDRRSKVRVAYPPRTFTRISSGRPNPHCSSHCGVFALCRLHPRLDPLRASSGHGCPATARGARSPYCLLHQRTASRHPHLREHHVGKVFDPPANGGLEARSAQGDSSETRTMAKFPVPVLKSKKVTNDISMECAQFFQFVRCNRELTKAFGPSIV